jgi:autotransporter-associated beta strand protein
MHVRNIALALTLTVSIALPGRVKAQPPTPDFTWNNFVSSGTQWANANNWLPAGPPTSSTDRVLSFGSSPLQNVAGYTTTNASGAFNLNSMEFNALSIASGGVVVTNTLATDSINFNTSSTNVLPSIWQTGTGRVSFRHAVAGSFGVTLAGGVGGTTLQILGGGIGDVYIDSGITSTGAGSSGLTINQTGALGFNTGANIRLGGSNSNFTGGVNLTAGNLMLSNVVNTSGAFNGTASVAATPVNSLGTGGTLTINGGTLQFDPLAISSGTSPSGITGTLQVNNPILLNANLNITGVAPATAPSGNLIGIFNGVISGTGGINIAPTNGSLVYSATAANTFSGAVNITGIGNTVATLQAGTANVSTGSFVNSTAFTVSNNSSLTLNNIAGIQTRLNTVTAPSLTLNRGNFNLFGNSAGAVSETMGQLTTVGMGSISVFTGSATVQSATMTFASLNRGADGRGTLSLSATNLGSGTGNGEGVISFTANPGGAIGGGGGAGTTTRSILPYALGNGQAVFAAASGTLSTAGTTLNGTLVTATTVGNVAGFVRWDSSTGRIVPLDPVTEYANNLYLAGTSAPNANHRYASTSGAQTAFGVAGMNNNSTINSLSLDTNLTSSVTLPVGLSIAGSGVLTVGSGAIIASNNGALTTSIANPSMINTGGLNFGSATGYIHSLASLTVTAPITGSGGLVKSQGGTLLLTGNNTFTGGLTVAAGPVQFAVDSNLGAASQPITLNSGLTTALSYQPSSLFQSSSNLNLTVSRAVTVGAGGGVINVTNINNTLTLSTGLAGSGPLAKVGAGTLSLTADNSAWTGTLSAIAGTTTVQNDLALGATTSGVVLGGTLQPLTSFSTASTRDFLVIGSPFFYTAGQNLTVNGNITSQGNAAGTLFKTGLGDLTLTNVNTFNGAFQNGLSSPASVVFGTTPAGTQTSGRTILSGANGSMPQASSVFTIAGGEIVLDNTASANANRIGNVTVSIIGGNFTLKGNAGTSINEQVGAISFSNGNNPYGGILTISTPAGSGQVTTLTSTATGLSSNAALGTVFVRGTNLGAGSGDRTALVFGTTPTAVNGLVPSLVVAGGTNGATSEPTTFAALTTISNAAPNANQFSVGLFSAYTAGGALGTGSATATYDVTTATSFTGAGLANALRLNGGSVTIGTTLTMTATAGPILAMSGAPSSITGGTLAFGGTNPARITVTTGSDLSIGSATSGTIGLVKAGSGSLILNTATSITGTVSVAQGTLQYGAGVNNALPVATNVFVNGGATLDINNTTSTLNNINGYGNINIGSGTLTVGATNAQTVAFGGAFSGNGTLIKSGSGITTTITGDSTAAFSGDVRILSGTLNVQGTGALGTGTTPILLGDTTGALQAIMTLGPTFANFSRDITVQAGGGSATAPHRVDAPAGGFTISSNIAINNTASTVTDTGVTIAGFGLQFRGTTGSTGGLNVQTGTISGPGGLYVFSGNWGFNGNNTYSGPTFMTTNTNGYVDAGIDSTPSAVGSTVTSGPFGTGTLTFTAFGTNLRAGGGARTIANQINLAQNPTGPAAAYFGVAGTNPLTLNGVMDLQASTTSPILNIMNTATTTIGGVIQNGTGGITKMGPGTLVLKGNNTYSGTTTVNAGILYADNTAGSATGSVGVSVNTGAILGGTGTVSGAITLSGGILAPGDATNDSILSTGSQPVFTSGIFSSRITGLAPGQFGELNVTSAGGSIALGNGITLSLANIYNGASDGTIDLIKDANGTSVTGAFANFPVDGSVVFTNPTTSLPYYIFYGTYPGEPGNVVLSAVPEPSTLLLGAAAAGGLAFRRWRHGRRRPVTAACAADWRPSA